MGVFRTAIQLAVIGAVIVGVRKALEQYENKAEELAQRIEAGGPSPGIDALARLHEALHKRKSEAGSGASNGSA
jgi:hypothetical protein